MSLGNTDPRATDRRNPGNVELREGAATSRLGGAPTAPPAGREGRVPFPVEKIDPRLARFFEKLSAGQFFGKVVVSFQNGKAVDVRIEQTKKLDEL
jgi:hypothetical protein